jgi:8-oxo-dGTP diphosphatase
LTGRPLIVHAVLFILREDLLQVLLEASESGRWSLPGVELAAEESLEEAANRLIFSLIDRRRIYLEQLYTYSAVKQPEVRVAYFALAPGDTLLASRQAARWFPAEGLPGLAGEQAEILDYALRRLRYKLEYSAVGFQLLPEEFTLSELQYTYELILGENLDKRNFRRRILQSGIIESTPRFRSGEGRPARLYHYRPDAVAEVKARRLFP